MNERLAVVTGGGSGIGLATVTRLLDDGWQVAALDRDAAALDRLAANSGGNGLTTHALDITDGSAVEALAASVAGKPLRALVNCAGLGANTSFMETSVEDFRRIYEVNVVAAFALAKHLVPRMETAGGGAIVNIASVSGIVGNFGRSAYGASKGALITLSKIMAVELAARKIRVNVVAPGPIETPLAQQYHTETTRRLWDQTVPMRRYGTPEEVAEAVRFFIDPNASSYVTGQILSVDGGFIAAGLTQAS
ncbi:SDR family NAD(P)-dependent oxidoreductase [Fulvimarina manganoxydans]|uniref:SDR family NAD(P)-dependent oxidoreductase n=1 Tax=Fulvimarina manganoxydans TaxID=937218 RepID=UPI002356045A|nr:SDR family oxidoreductase [Fulvimarina manganoxydans]